MLRDYVEYPIYKNASGQLVFCYDVWDGENGDTLYHGFCIPDVNIDITTGLGDLMNEHSTDMITYVQKRCEPFNWTYVKSIRFVQVDDNDSDDSYRKKLNSCLKFNACTVDEQRHWDDECINCGGC